MADPNKDPEMPAEQQERFDRGSTEERMRGRADEDPSEYDGDEDEVESIDDDANEDSE
jgi:hypothetical protein